jgi:transketolase
VLYDDNSISIDGPTSLSFTDNTAQRFEAYGWHVQKIDGHDPAQIATSISNAHHSGKPNLICCKTTIGYGAPTKGGTAATHGSPLGKEEVAATRAALGWTHAPFEVPENILKEWRRVGSCGAAEFEAWSERVGHHPQRAEYLRALKGELPAAVNTAIEALKKETSEKQPKVATRQSSGNVLQAIMPVLPELIGGSADLTPSNNTKTKDLPVVSRGHYDGRYLHWGVREHGMAAAMNGMALHGGIIPYSGTFLTFTDYCRPAIRLAALMQQKVIYVMTHDSIGLGEDGPTHQPVEHLAALRAMPGVLTFRPCDTVETAECWQYALAHQGPSVMVLSRQALPTARTTHESGNLSAKGGYILREAKAQRQVTLLATGSEVSIALTAAEMLEKQGLGTAVVSLPSFELFAAQPLSYREHVLGPGTVRVGIEAAIRQGWDAVLGAHSDFVGMSGFGASAPAEHLYQHFGITAEKVVERAQQLLSQLSGTEKLHKSKTLI